jgi:hypothetical protein
MSGTLDISASPSAGASTGLFAKERTIAFGPASTARCSSGCSVLSFKE